MGRGLELARMDGATRLVSWRGRSGRLYGLTTLRFESFRLKPGELYLVALGRHALWAGTAEDLVADAVSRARFRLALDCGDRAFRIEEAGDEMTRMSIGWDLEGAEPEPALNAAA